MSADSKLQPSDSRPGTSQVIQNRVYVPAQASQVGKDLPGSGSQDGRHSIQPICNQETFKDNVPRVIITSGQRQSQTPKTVKRSSLIAVPIDGRYQQGQKQLYSNQEAVKASTQPVCKTANMEDLCREKTGVALFQMAPCGNDPVPTPMRTPPSIPPPSSTFPSLASHPVLSSHVPSVQQDYSKPPSKSQPVLQLSVPTPPPYNPQICEQPSMCWHVVSQTNSGPTIQSDVSRVQTMQQPHEKSLSQISRETKSQELAMISANLRAESSPKIPATDLSVKAFAEKKPKDLFTCRLKDQGTLVPALDPNVMRGAVRAADSKELKAPGIKEGSLLSTKLNTPEKNLAQPLVKQSSGSPKDPRTCQQKDQILAGTAFIPSNKEQILAGTAFIPSNNKISLGLTTPRDSEVSRVKDGCMPTTNESKPEKSHGQFLVKQPSESPKDPSSDQQQDQQTLGPSFISSSNKISCGPATPSDSKIPSIKDRCLPATNESKPESPGKVLVKRPSESPKDPSSDQQKDQGPPGPSFIPSNIQTSLGLTTSGNSKTFSIKDGHFPTTNESKPEKSPGKFFVKQPSESPKDPSSYQQKDQETPGPSLIPSNIQTSLGPTTSGNSKISSIEDGCLATTNESKPEKSPGKFLVKQLSGSPKDPSSYQQKDQGTPGPSFIPSNIQTSLGPTTSVNSKTFSIKDGRFPTTNESKPEKSPGKFLLKQLSESPRDPSSDQQKDQGTPQPSFILSNIQTSLGLTMSGNLRTSSIKDGCLAITNESKPEKIPGKLLVKKPSESPKDPSTCQQKDKQKFLHGFSQSTSRSNVSIRNKLGLQSRVKQPKVVLKRLKTSHCHQNFSRGGRDPNEHRSTAEELRNAHWALRSAIQALTKDEDKKSVHFSKEISTLNPSVSESAIRKHHVSSHSSSRDLHSSPSKSSMAKDPHLQSKKHLFRRSKSFSYSSSWRTPHIIKVAPSPSSDPSGKMKANSSVTQVKQSSNQLYGKHFARTLSYEERKSLPLSASRTTPSASDLTDSDSWNESDQRGVWMRSKPSSHSTGSKQILSSPGLKLSTTTESKLIGNLAKTSSDSEADVRKTLPALFKQKSKPAEPLMVDKKSKHPPNHPLNQSEGKGKGSSSHSQKSSSFGSSENQPSFMQLLEIASQNAKGSQVGYPDLQCSRKRRYSDGQINRCQPTDPRHFMVPFREGVSSIKIPKLERLKEHTGETSDSGNVKAMKDKSILTHGKGNDQMGEGSGAGKGMQGTAADISNKSTCESEENGISVNEVGEIPSSSSGSNKIQEGARACDEENDITMSFEDIPGMTEDAEKTIDDDAPSIPSSDTRKQTRTSLTEMPEKSERKVEDSASTMEDVKEARLFGAGVQGLFSELQKSVEESKASNPSSPARSSKASSPSGSEKRSFNINHLKKVRHILTGIVSKKKQAIVDSDASTKDGSSSSTPSPNLSGDERQNIIPPPAEDKKEKVRNFLEETDIFTTENSDSESSEDDDSFLHVKPSALIEETNALMDVPMPVTPSKMSHSQVSYSPVLPHPTRIRQQGTVERPQVGNTLDKILKDMKDGDITAARDMKLMDFVSKGGIAKLATETEDIDEDIDVDAEGVDYANCLAKFPTKSETIPDIPPGEDIFYPEKMCQLFTPTKCLCVKNFLPHRDNETSMENLLLSATPEEVEDIITSTCLELCESAPDDMMRWMFLLMSIHPSARESHSLYQTQWMHLNQAPLISDELRFPWIPSLKDILSVLLNYGGDLGKLVSVSDCQLDFSEEMLRDEFSGQDDGSAERRDKCFTEEEGMFVMILKNNLCQVIKIITQAILTHMTLKDCSGYRTEELQCLLIVMMKIALDKTVLRLPVAVDITMAIAAILEGFEDSVWYQEVESMCVLFPFMTSHHHNMVYLLWSCMPLHIERGRYLCRRLSYAGLERLVLPDGNTQRLPSTLDERGPCIKISSLIPILQCCKPSAATDYYQLNSIIQLLDYSIGNETLEISEKKELQQIIGKLREMVGDIRESALSLSRSQVKSLIVRTQTKLNFMTQSMLTNQESIFSFLRSDTPVGMEEEEEEGNPEHHIRSQDDAASLPSDGEEADDASAMEMEPFSDDEMDAEDGNVRLKDDSKILSDVVGEEGRTAKECNRKIDFEEQHVKEGQTEDSSSGNSGKACASLDLQQESDHVSGLEEMETSRDQEDLLETEIFTSEGVEHASKEIQPNSEGVEHASKEIQPNREGVDHASKEIQPNSKGVEHASKEIQPNSKGVEHASMEIQTNREGAELASMVIQPSSVGVEHASKEIQPNSKGVEHASMEIQTNREGAELASKEIQPNSDRFEHASKEIQLNSEGVEHASKEIQLNSEGVGHASKEIQLNSEGVEHAPEEMQLKPGVQAGEEKTKTFKGVQLEPEMNARVEVRKTTENKDLEQESEIAAGVEVDRGSGSEKTELQPEIFVNISKSITLGDKDLNQESEISVGVQEIQTAGVKTLEQKSEVLAGSEVQELPTRKSFEVEPDVELAVQATESSKSTEMGLKPDVQVCPPAGESLSDKDNQLDPRVQAVTLSEETGNSKDLQVSVGPGDVSKGDNVGEESSLEKKRTCPDVVNVVKVVTSVPCVGQVISPEKVAMTSSPTKESLWVPVKVESDLSPIKGRLEVQVKEEKQENIKGSVPVCSGEDALPAAVGVAKIKIEKDDEIIDLTSPESMDVSSRSTLEVIDVELDDSDVICLD